MRFFPADVETRNKCDNTEGTDTNRAPRHSTIPINETVHSVGGSSSSARCSVLELWGCLSFKSTDTEDTDTNGVPRHSIIPINEAVHSVGRAFLPSVLSVFEL